MAIAKTAKQIADEKFKAQLTAKINSLSPDKKEELKNNKSKQAEIEAAYKAYVNKPVVNTTGKFDSQAWKDKMSNKNIPPVNTKVVNTKITPGKEYTDYKMVNGQRVLKENISNNNDVLKAEQALAKAEADRKNKFESGVTDVEEAAATADAGNDITYTQEGGAYTDAMNKTSNTFEDLNNATAAAKNLKEKEYAQLAEDKLRSILDPLMKEYGENTKQFTQILDQAMEQNKISIANQRKIADQFRESAGVEALIAGSKVGPGMSESQIQALGKDISIGYQDAISKAEGNYEQARINGWNTLKTLGMDGKMAQDALLTVTEKLGLAAAEPYLMSLANSKTNLNDVLDKVNELKTGSQKALYEDAFEKEKIKQGQATRSVEWEKGSPQERQALIYQAMPKNVNIPSDVVNKMVADKNLDWMQIYQRMEDLGNISETLRGGLFQQIATGKISVDEGMKKINELVKVSGKDFDQTLKGETIVDTGTVETPVTPPSLTDLSNMTNTVNTTKEDKAIQTAKTNVNNSYEKYIAGLKPTDKAMLDKVKTLSPAKKTEAINRINNSNKSKEIKSALIYYINK